MKLLLKIVLHYAILLIALFLSPGYILAQQNNDYFFQKLTTFNGLSSDYIQCIFRDSRGYVWIGTNYGLNRYDGRNIKVYHNEPTDPHSLPQESVFHIAEDKNGILWINGGFGLIEFDPLTEQFNYFKHDPDEPKSLASVYPVPFVDSKNNLWAATYDGLQLFNRKDKSFELFMLVPPDSLKAHPGSGSVRAIVEDNEHNVWCGGNEGLYRFDNVTRELKLFPFQDRSYGTISDIFIDHEGNFWVVFWKTGINLFHSESGKYEPVAPFKTDRFNLFGKMTEWKDPSGVYWLAICTQYGLLMYDCKSGEKKIILNDPLNSSSLIYNDTYFVYTDPENLLWIGTKKGLNILNNADQVFHVKIISQGNPADDSKVKSTIEDIYEDPDVRMVSFMWTKGMGIYDKNWNLLRFYNSIPPADTSLEARNIFSIIRDTRGIYWITTDNGLVRFDIRNNSFKVFQPPEVDMTPGKDRISMRQIIPFDSTSFYILSELYGIYKFDFKQERYLQHLSHNDNDPLSLPSNMLRSALKVDENHLVIVSIHNGIFIYNTRANTFLTYDRSADASIKEAIHNLHYDPSLSGHILWVNSIYGLVRFDLFTKKFELFNSRQGLANDVSLSNEVDERGNVWVAHHTGISMLDTAKRTFTNYSEKDGLVFQEFGGNMRKMSDGSIYIGDRDRLVFFNPYQFKSEQHIPQVCIYSVRVLNEPVKFEIDSVTHKKSLILNYNQDLITVDFSVLNFSHPDKNGFYFRLDQDSTWLRLNEGTVNLVKLAPGNYTLQVTGSNDIGVMNPAGDILYISILPPYYQTWWFRLVIFAGLVGIVLIIRYRGIRSIRHEEYLKTEFNKQLAQAETKALRAQMNPHFIFNSLNSINSMVMEQKHEIASDYLIKFSKLIRLILDNSRSEMITIDKELETLKLYVLLESVRFDNRFKCLYQVDDDVNTSSIMIPPMLLQPFVENAIWHGLMQKEGEGTIIIEIKKIDDEYLKISITDDGIGREKAAELNSKSATHKSHGLKVTSQRIEMMNKLNSTGAKVQIIDLKDDQGNATGTKVELIIPY